MKKINWEKELPVIAWILSIFAGIALLLLFLIFVVDGVLGLFIAVVLISLIYKVYSPVAMFCLLVFLTVLVLLLRMFFVKRFSNYNSVERQVEDAIEKKRPKWRIIISVLVIIAIVGFGGGYVLYFWYYETHTGSRNGKVIDAVMGKPIEGAVVYYTWAFSGFMTMRGGIAADYETTTNKDGYYLIPNQRVAKRIAFFDSLKPESVLIYKNNYAVYTLVREYKKPTVCSSFGYPGKDQIYHKKNNLVKLYPWKVGEWHYMHIDVIKSERAYRKSELLKKELEEEKERAHEEQLSKHR